MSDSKKLDDSEIEVSLQSLGFTKNDSKVLLTLCKYKILSPADIAKHSGVDRARVYDSLNRLIEKGFIQKEPIKRGANYQVIPIDKIFKAIRDQYKIKIEDTLLLEKVIGELEINKEESEPRVWAINSRGKIRKKIKELIVSSNEKIFFIITPDLLLQELGGYDWILKELWNKKFSSNIQIIIALKYNDTLKEEIKKLLKIAITIHSIEGDSVIPFGLLITDNHFLLTTLDSVREAPEYTSGLWLENGTPKQIVGYEHLFKHFITSECKLIKLTPIKIVPD
ncbi:MAG: TrmB family transcriptional regulator [Candidatus Lokiarchaeota archaeon]|nr:TrmB family transcriptional regulator [Candidatus Lokiarchaeota archaeon]